VAHFVVIKIKVLRWQRSGPQTNQLSGRIFTHNLGNSPIELHDRAQMRDIDDGSSLHGAIMDDRWRHACHGQCEREASVISRWRTQLVMPMYRLITDWLNVMRFMRLQAVAAWLCVCWTMSGFSTSITWCSTPITTASMDTTAASHWQLLGYSYRSVVIVCFLFLWFTLCSPTSRSTNQWGLGLSGLVHKEAHPTVPNIC